MKIYFKVKPFTLIVLAWLAVTSTVYATQVLEFPPRFESNLSLLVVKADNGQIIYQHNQTIPRLIASNMKLFTTAISLNQLGADYHWHTRLYYSGKINQHTLNGNLFLKGSGDPTLDSKALYLIFSQLKILDIESINGNIILDDKVFTTKPKYSMLNYQKYDSDTVLPNGIIIDGNLSHIYIDNLDNYFKVSSNVYGYQLINHLQINAQESKCSNSYTKLQIKASKKNLLISGALSKSCNNLDLVYNLLPSFSYNQMSVQKILAGLEIKLNGDYQQGVAPADLNLVYDYSSASLEEILIRMNRFSNNLIAETVLLQSGVAKYPALNSYAGEQRLFHDFLSQNGLSNPMFSLENGAGLSRHEYFSCQNIVKLLAQLNGSRQWANFEATLAVNGQEGTLESSFPQFKYQIHAKTGTLDDTKSLSGYFYSQAGNKYIFSVVLNDFDSNNAENMKLFNQSLEALFSELNKK